MKKSATLLVLFLIPALASALAVQSCAGGESTGSGSGGKTGSGGSTNTGTGGFTNTGTGGFTNTGTGGITNTGTGGITNTGTGGMVGGGTGGMIGGGTGGMVGGGTGGTVVTGGAITVTTGGFATNGTWMGYAYTSAGPPPPGVTTATISALPATTLCANGTVGMDATFNSTALLGWNINQVVSTSAVSPPINPVTPTKTGMLVNVSGMTAGLRVQIQNGDTMRWCAMLTGAGPVMIPWTMFNTTCYNTIAGTYYAKTPITAVQIIVPSSATASVPFNFCLVDAHEY